MDGPGSRCGHTLMSMAEVREDGSLGYIGPRLILFGGATELEGNSGTAMPSPSPTGSAGIRAMADVHCYDVLPNNWSRLTPLGEPPSSRAAPVATTVGMMVVIKGGIGPAGLSAEDLHVLDLTQQRPRWHSQQYNLPWDQIHHPLSSSSPLRSLSTGSSKGVITFVSTGSSEYSSLLLPPIFLHQVAMTRP